MTIVEIKKSTLLEKAIDENVYELRDILQEIEYIIDVFKMAATDKKKILSDNYSLTGLTKPELLENGFDKIYSTLLEKMEAVKNVRDRICNLKESDIEIKIV